MTKRKASTKTKIAPKTQGKKTSAVPALTNHTSKSKIEVCLALLRRKEGATIDQMQRATGWQAHSVRGMLSGKVKKMDGFTLTSEKTSAGERRYHVKAA